MNQTDYLHQFQHKGGPLQTGPDVQSGFHGEGSPSRRVDF